MLRGTVRRAFGMRRTWIAASMILGVVFCAVAAPFDSEWTSGILWPEPKVIDPGPAGGPPSDAVVLFDGKDLSQWEGGEKWIVQDGCAVSQQTDIRTKQAFGDCQLHLEWAAPEKVEGSGQGRGNSGVFFMDTYELQILDSYQNPTYFDGQAGSIYKQHPPLVNACRKPGEWQSFDVVFTAPRFDENGKLTTPAFVTVFHNAVVVQNHFEIKGATAWHKPPEYPVHPPKMPMRLQFHGNPVRFRNIWVREVEELKPATPATVTTTATAATPTSTCRSTRSLPRSPTPMNL